MVSDCRFATVYPVPGAMTSRLKYVGIGIAVLTSAQVSVKAAEAGVVSFVAERVATWQAPSISLPVGTVVQPLIRRVGEASQGIFI